MNELKASFSNKSDVFLTFSYAPFKSKMNRFAQLIVRLKVEKLKQQVDKRIDEQFQPCSLTNLCVYNTNQQLNIGYAYALHRKTSTESATSTHF